MSEKNENSDVAKKFLEIWQKQLEHLSSDPETASQIFQSMEMMQQQYFHIFNNSQNSEGNSFANTIFSNMPISNSALSQYGDDEFLELKLRISKCEKRIAELESCLTK